jgi:hypothetical protein
MAAMLICTGVISVARMLGGDVPSLKTKSTAQSFWKGSKNLAEVIMADLKKVENEGEDS